MKPIQTRILNEKRQLENLYQWNPLEDRDSRNQFLSNFDWTNFTPDSVAEKAVEVLLVDFHNIFARKCCDVGDNTAFKVQLAPLENRLACSRIFPAPINLKDNILVELALQLNYGIITKLHFINYASPIFAQRKPNAKLCLLFDIRKINSIITDYFINNHHPVSKLTDAAQHVQGKTFSANRIVPKLTSASKWQIKNPFNFLSSTVLTENSHTEDWLTDFVVPYLPFQASFRDTSIQSLKPIDVQNMLMIPA